MSAATVTIAEDRPAQGQKPRDLSIDYLRTTITVLVVLHHTMLAYCTWAVQPSSNLFHTIVPLVDVTRWRFFDHVVSFDDHFQMVLMFFISGLFVPSSIRKHSTTEFLRDRCLRLGLPFIFTVVVLNPIGFYAPWRIIGHTTGFSDMYRQLAGRGFSPGPAWFLWVLLLFDFMLALTLPVLSQALKLAPGLWTAQSFEKVARLCRNQPLLVACLMFVASVAVYLPMLVHYGFGNWKELVTTPFTYQIARFYLYLLWFCFGALVGASGVTRGLLDRDGALARRWPYWLACGLLAFIAAEFVPGWLWQHHILVAHMRTPPALLWVTSCVASCFALLALFIGVSWQPRRWMLSLNRSAYGLYLVHAVFIMWLQRLFFGSPLHPFLKAAIIFVATVLLGWLTTQLALRLPKVKTII